MAFSDAQRRQLLYYKDGAMFVKERQESSRQPTQSLASSLSNGERPRNSEPLKLGNVLSFDAYSEDAGIDESIRRIRAAQLESMKLRHDREKLRFKNTQFYNVSQDQLYCQRSLGYDGNPSILWSDFRVGDQVSLQGKRLNITGCDDFTRKYFEDNGIRMKDNDTLPKDVWVQMETNSGKEAKLENPREDREAIEPGNPVLNQKLPPPPSMLIYKCYWLDGTVDRHNSLFRRAFKMFVYPADNTVALLEETKEFEGQLFLKRITLPFPVQPNEPRRFYSWKEIKPETWVDIFCRPMFVYGCGNDETRHFVQQQFGHEYSNSKIPFVAEEIPHVMAFRCTMVDAPSGLYGTRFLLLYDTYRRVVDVVEEGRVEWTQEKLFLRSIDASRFNEEDFVPGRIITLFKWRFNVVECDPQTTAYFRSKPAH